MNTHTNISTRRAAAAATAAGVVTTIFGILSITDSQSSESTTVGIEHVILGGLTASLLLLVPVVLHIGRVVGRPRAARIAVTGQVALAVLTVISNVRGEDAAFFAAVAVPSNLMILGGFIALAVALRRSGTLSSALSIALPFSLVSTLALGGVFAPIAGAYWLAIGWTLNHGELPRPAIGAEAATS